MGQTLTNGIYLPDEGEVRCYAGLASNWTTLDAVVGGYNAHVANENIHITSAERNKWDNGVTQAYVLRYASVSLTALGTVAFSALDNTDNIKIGDKVLDSEGKLFALTAVDTANTSATLSALLIDLSKDSDLSNYYTKTETDTLLNDKADDSGVMHLAGDETASGKKTFGDVATFDGSYLGTEASINGRTDLILESNRDTHGQSGLLVTKFRQNRAQGGLSGNDVVYLTLDLLENSVRTNGIFSFNFRDFVNDIPQDIAFYPTGSKNSLGRAASGSSKNKWHFINGIQPGALSLPNLSGGVDISSYITLGTYIQSTYIPPANGYISIMIYGSAASGLYVYSGTFGTGMRSIGGHPTYGQVCVVFLPVLANTTYTIECTGATNIGWAKFYPCQGNV